jgi:hypothetical protein
MSLWACYPIVFLLSGGMVPTETRKVPTMANDEFEFEIIPEDEIQKVARGRKSNVDPKLVEGLRNLKKGSAVRLPKMKCDPKSVDYKKDKARVSANLRAAMKMAGHGKFGIVFTPDGIPQIKIG